MRRCGLAGLEVDPGGFGRDWGPMGIFSGLDRQDILLLGKSREGDAHGRFYRSDRR